MADSPTLGVNLGGLITTSGAVNTQVLQSLANFIVGKNYTNVTQAGGLAVGANVFAGLNATGGVTQLDPAAGGVNTNGFAETVRGGGADTAILAPGGNIDYAGSAGHFFVYNGTGTINSTAAAATIKAVTGSYVITGTGADHYYLGGVGASVTARSAGLSTAVLEGGVSYSGGNSDTISAIAGTSTVFAGANSTYTDAGATSVFFVGTATANTVFGGAGADTVYGDGTLYVAGAGNKVFAGSTVDASAASTSAIYTGSGGAATVQAGVRGDQVFLQGSADRIVSGGGRDTIVGNAAAVAPTIFGTTGSYELLVGKMQSGLAIGLGNNTTIDGANTTGGLNYFANPGYGNQTFIGSQTGNDAFNILTQNVGSSLITIQNWHVGDQLNLTSQSAADQAVATKAIAAGQNIFKLSNGTTVVFAGNHPTSGTNGFYT